MCRCLSHSSNRAAAAYIILPPSAAAAPPAAAAAAPPLDPAAAAPPPKAAAPSATASGLTFTLIVKLLLVTWVGLGSGLDSEVSAALAAFPLAARALLYLARTAASYAIC